MSLREKEILIEFWRRLGSLGVEIKWAWACGCPYQAQEDLGLDFEQLGLAQFLFFFLVKLVTFLWALAGL